MEPVRTHRAKSVVEAARLHRARDRRERGLTLVEGQDLIADVVAAGAELVEAYAVEPKPGSDELAVDHRALERLAGTKSPRGPVAVVRIPTEWLDRDRNLLVSIGVSDPGNLGTMIRTAAAVGWGFAYTEGSGGSVEASITPMRYAHEIVLKRSSGGIGETDSRSSHRMQNDTAVEPLTTCGFNQGAGSRFSSSSGGIR